MIGSLIPDAKRLANRTPPIDPDDMTEANANNYMFLFDNIATGEYMEDCAIVARHLANLRCREQASPNLTLEVLAGAATFATTFLSFAGGNTPSITAPAANPRIDIICIDNTGTITRTAGVEAGSPVAPAVPINSIPLCSVYCVVGMTTVRDNDDQVAGQGYILNDLRPFFGLGGGVIRSIQKGTISVTITTSSLNPQVATNTATITSVDTSKAFVIFEGVERVSSTFIIAGIVGRAELTNATTVTASLSMNTQNGSNSDTVVYKIGYTVVEYL